MPNGTDAFGRPLYFRPLPRNFLIVVEAKRGVNNKDPGKGVFNSDLMDPSALPDLQIQSNRPLGNGSPLVCDKGDPYLGGVPAISAGCDAQCRANALNDFGCRFIVHSKSEDACTLGPDGPPERFVASATTVQFCFEPAVGSEVGFPEGDTVLTVRVRDVSGSLGDPAEITVRVPPQQ